MAIVLHMTIAFFNFFRKLLMVGIKYVYRGGSRELRKIINTLLKSGVAQEIQKVNYVQSFSLMGKNVEKSEIKNLLIFTDDEKKLSDFLQENFAELERLG